MRFAWGATAGASDYIVRSDTAPDGGFATMVGVTSDPVSGLSVPMTADTEFYLVAGRHPVCGEGPLH